MKTLLVAGLLVFTAGAASAATEADFDAADSNHDGRLTMQEMQMAYPDTTPDVFKDYDMNRDGTLDAKEFVLSMPASELDGMINIRPKM